MTNWLVFIASVLFFILGFFWSRLMEWRRTLAYLHHYEETNSSKPLWWLAAGIAADEHWDSSLWDRRDSDVPG